MFKFNALKVYEGGWTLSSEEVLNPANVSKVKIAVVEASKEYEGKLSVKMHFHTGGYSYLQLSRDSKLGVGDVVDLSKGVMQRLVRGNEECWKFLEK